MGAPRPWWPSQELTLSWCAACPQPQVRGWGGQGRAGTRQPQPRPPLPGLAWLQAKSGCQSSETRMHGALRDHPLMTWPLPQRWERPQAASAASGVPLLVSPAFLPPPSSSAFPCRSLVSSPRPGPGHAPVHFRLLLRPPRFLQDEAEEGGSSQAAGNSSVSRTGGHSQPLPLAEARSRKPPSERGSSLVT